VSVAEAKQRLRREMGDLRRQVAPALREQVGDAVARVVLTWPELGAHRRVVLHAALPDEVPTLPLVQALLARGHEVLLQRASGAGTLEFARVTDVSSLVRGRFGALQPPRDESPRSLSIGDLVLIPGVAFDRSGGRLGRGGGWYDRSLPNDVVDVFGIAFAFQLVDRVPVTSLDRRVRGIFTEQGLLRCMPRSVSCGRDPSRDPS
jgi:5-formyltetrahydrofolate cyclo-ligase